MRTATAIGSLSLLLFAGQGVHADRIYFSLSGSTHHSTFGSSTYSSFSFGTAPQVVHVNRPTTIIITSGQPVTIITQGQRPYATGCHRPPVVIQSGHYHGQYQPHGTWHSPQVVTRPGGWYNVPNGNRYPGFPYSHSQTYSTWSRHTPPSTTRILQNWPNSSTTQGFRRGWTLTGR